MKIAPLVSLALLVPLSGCNALGLCDEPPPRALTGDEADLAVLVEGNDDFAWALFDVVSETSTENVFFSPLSVAAAFGMVYAGADGNTAAELEQALAIGLQGDAWHSMFGALLDDLDTGRSCGPVEIAIANQVFAKDGFSIHDEYLEVLEQDYGAPLETYEDAATGVDLVNDWVDDETRGHIPKLVDELAESTVLVLANAIYMKADWSEPFDSERTSSDPFLLEGGTEIQVDTMHGTVTGSWGLVEGGQVVSLPYQGNELEMLLALPDEDVALADFEEGLAAGGTSSLTADLTPFDLVLSLPKFELRQRLDLIPILSQLGVEDLFVPSQADLSGVSEAQLFVDKAVHEAWVLVEEEGTEAAAATMVSATPTSATVAVAVDFDRPFVFQVRDQVTGTVLFLGRVADPRVSD